MEWREVKSMPSNYSAHSPKPPWGLSLAMYPLATSNARERVLLPCLRDFEVGDARTGELTLESLSSFLPLHLLVYFCLHQEKT